LVRDLADSMNTRVSTRIELHVPGQKHVTFGPGAGVAVTVSGPVQQLAGWLAGRSRGARLTAPDGLPELPPWM
jgi:hypothetical protein